MWIQIYSVLTNHPKGRGWQFNHHEASKQTMVKRTTMTIAERMLLNACTLDHLPTKLRSPWDTMQICINASQYRKQSCVESTLLKQGCWYALPYDNRCESCIGDVVILSVKASITVCFVLLSFATFVFSFAACVVWAAFLMLLQFSCGCCDTLSDVKSSWQS